MIPPNSDCALLCKDSATVWMFEEADAQFNRCPVEPVARKQCIRQDSEALSIKREGLFSAYWDIVAAVLSL